MHNRTQRPRSNRRLKADADAALVLVSGGLDSATALYWAKARYAPVWALSVEVAGRPPGERRCARRLAAAAGVRLLEAETPFFKDAARLRADGFEVPRGTGLPGFVPMRNLVLWGIAAYFAEVVGATAVVGGHLRTDRDFFPDAAPPFFEALETVIGIANGSLRGKPLRLLLPFANATKTEVLAAALQIGVPLASTWSCYAGAARPCGECLSCLQRAKAFQEKDVADPAARRLRTSLSPA
jgi:7-cyano-7-deazaguanine synthase